MNLLSLLPKRARVLALCALVIPSLLLLVSAFIAFRSEERLLLSVRWVEHTHAVEAALQSVSVRQAVLLAESPSLVFSEHSFADAADRLRQEVARVEQLTLDNPEQQARLVQLSAATEKAIAAFARERAGEPGHPETLRQADLIVQLADQMRVEEERLLQVRQQSLKRRIHIRTLGIWGLVGFNVLMIFGLASLVFRQGRLESLVTMCAWTRTIQYQGRWLTFEEYLSQRFQISTSHGISPDEAERLVAQSLPPEVEDGLQPAHASSAKM